MSVRLILVRVVDGGSPLELGPFPRIELRHRRLLAGRETLAVRRTNGLWQHGDRRFIEASIKPARGGRSVHLELTDGWARDTRRMTTDVIRLFADRMLSGRSSEWFMSDVDDAGSWVAEDTGNAYERLMAA